MKILKVLITCLGGLFLFCLIVVTAGVVYLSRDLPDVTELKTVRLQTPMRVYSADGELMAWFGERLRTPVAYEQIPPQLINAVLATEDRRFYEHMGFDPIGITRALFVAASTGRLSQGGSTITQQLAKNFFLSPDRTLERKLKELILALQIEKHLTKEEILTLYLNKIYFGARSYGIAAAAYTYFGKELASLSLDEIAIIAGLPKAPAAYNPIYYKEKARARRDLVLSRMLDQHFITQSQYEEAKSQPITAYYHEPEVAFSAPYVAEMVRQVMFDKYGEHAYEDGFEIYTTISRTHQLAAIDAVKSNIFDYDRRHGYRGAEQVLWQADQPSWSSSRIMEYLAEKSTYLGLQPVVVVNVNDVYAQAMNKDGKLIKLTMDAVRWARPYISDRRQGALPKRVSDVLSAGQMIRVEQVNHEWIVSQLPQVNSAFVSLSPKDGAVTAMVGGVDYGLSKFNRVTQSVRQVGSSIKPFIYAAALNKGLTMATLLNDAPIVRKTSENQAWQPKNSPDTYMGPTRLRVGIGTSKNVMMVRVARAIGIGYAADFLGRFQFPKQNISRTESLALGAASFTPLQLARGYSAFVNGGYLVTPYFIDHIKLAGSKVIYQAHPKVACQTCNVPVKYDQMEKMQVEEQVESEDKPNEDAILNDKLPNEESVVSDESNLLAQLPDDPHNDNQPIVLADHRVNYAPKVIRDGVAFIISDGLVGNIWGEEHEKWLGTGWRARVLKRRDIGGKTGTTNASKDAWYSGFGPDTVAVVWVGFDNHQRELGRSRLDSLTNSVIVGEGAARTALPVWIAFMKTVLANVPEQRLQPPHDVVSVTIDRRSGLRAEPSSDTRSEYFIIGTEPSKKHLDMTKSTILDQDGNEVELF